MSVTAIRDASLTDMIAWLKTWRDEDRRVIAKSIMPPAKRRYVTKPLGMNPVSTIPRSKPVKILSVTGIECVAVVSRRTLWVRRADKYGPSCILCRRLDGKTSGDVWAIGWKPCGATATATVPPTPGDGE